MTSSRNLMKVYLSCPSIIAKEQIFSLEKALRKGLPLPQETKVVVEESFCLSGELSQKQIWKRYRNDMLIELREKNRLLWQTMQGATVSFSEDEKMHVSLTRNILSESRQKELQAYFTSVFSKRFGIDGFVAFELHEQDPGEEEKAKEERIAALVEERLKAIHELKSATISADVPFDTQSQAETPKVAAPKKAPGQGYGRGGRKRLKKADFPDLLYGSPFDDEPVPLSEVTMIPGEITVRGAVISVEEKPIRDERTILIFVISDETDSISGKLFVHNEELDDYREFIAKGKLLLIKGFADVDRFDNEYSLQRISGIRSCPEFRKKRIDNAPLKRVELHCHTKMSGMDGLTTPEDIVKNAFAMGHRAVSITDHGVVHGFPEAFHALEGLRKKNPEKAEGFKIIYGMEGYVVDDELDLVVGDKGQDFSGAFVVVDLETTGFSAKEDMIIEIGAVRVENGVITDRFSTFVNPHRPIPGRIQELTSITDSMVEDAPGIEEALPSFLAFSEGASFVAHNAGFDLGFLMEKARKLDLSFDPTYLDTVSMARILLPELSRFKLDTVARKLGVSLDHHHRAVDDANCTAEIFLKFLPMLEEKEIHTLSDLSSVHLTPDVIKKLRTNHIILLAKNEEGRKNLYRLVSKSHLQYYAKRPRIPKSVLAEYREGLIIGSACVAGEVLDAILSKRSDEQIDRIVRFYDYLEVQPIDNNRFLLHDSRYPDIRTDEDLQNLNRRVLALGEQYEKPVVATCDVHFFNPEDEICRRIIMAGNGFKDVDRPEPLYFRTTEEMLHEFSYLPKEQAEEIVITNPNLVCDEVEEIAPVRPDKCPPQIENSDQILRDSCYEKARELYGETLPVQVEERLEKELNSIISNGYAVMYIIAQKLVKKSNEDGYLVGSRGSVGSSLAAFMAGITEVNSLSPHYYCSHCHYVDFDSEEVRSYAMSCGLDMPEKKCPVCGETLKKDGWNIPFETFLGFKGNKEPDIDLNFSGDYQAKAHRYTEVIFGKGHTFKAGTIATVADKTTYGYVAHYFADRNIPKRKCELNRIVDKCVGVRKSTGQHPGGIIVLPHGEEIDTFTPVQHPANDTKTDIITTHFDYHSIDQNLLKLDILGHDDPTMVRRLEDLTGVSVQDIPLDDPGVFSLFHSTEALGITPDQIHNCNLGCLGIPEFGTKFVIGLLEEAKPKSFSDLIRISGLSHGTDVWVNNAQTLVQEGTCDLSGAICTRDDIMTYLIAKGMESELSFKIMESVRKGKGLSEEWETLMQENDVPDWYIWSCKQIKYMFPKAHAVAYVTMALRIAYCKVHYPQAYYAAYFAIRAKAFSYEVMCRGPEVLADYFRQLEAKTKDERSPKEEAMMDDMRIVEEMYARGIEFLPIDIYRAKPSQFQIIDGKIMPSLSSIDGMGEKAAETLYAAAKEGEFLSKEDIHIRGKVTNAILDKMTELHLLEGMSESNQMSLMDLFG